MRRGEMNFEEFEDIVFRNMSFPNVRFILSRWGARQGAPRHNVAIVMGNSDLGDAYNVPVPVIPEHTITHPDRPVIVARGWRELFRMLVDDGTVVESEEIRALLDNA